MAWQIRFTAQADKAMSKLDVQINRRIIAFLEERIANLDDPRSVGEALKGSRLGEFWKYRVGDWRIICDIQDDALVILALNIGNRREVYK